MGNAVQVLNGETPPSLAEGEEVPSAVDLSIRLNRTILGLYGDFVDDHAVDYNGLRESEGFSQYVESVQQLHLVDPSELEKDARIAFWINLYNMLMIHVTTVNGAPKSSSDRRSQFSSFAYIVHGQQMTLDDIEHGVLRANSKAPGRLWPCFSDGDERLSFACEAVEPRIHFALNCGAKSCPPVRIFKAATLDKSLDRAARWFCGEYVEVEVSGHVRLSQIFKWYGSDFGSEKQMMMFIVDHVEDIEAAELLRKLVSKQLYKTSWMPYDWGTNAKTDEGARKKKKSAKKGGKS